MLDIYDVRMDEQRPATQQDIDDLQTGVQRLGLLRVDLLKIMVANFPKVAQELEFGDALNRRLKRDFYRANSRQPNSDELQAAFEAFQNDGRV